MIKIQKQIKECILQYTYILQLLKTEINPVLVTELFWFVCPFKNINKCRLAVCFIVCTLLEKRTQNLNFLSSYKSWSQKVQWLKVHRAEVQKNIMSLTFKCGAKTGGLSIVEVLLLSLLQDSWLNFGQPYDISLCLFRKMGSWTALRSGKVRSRIKAFTARLVDFPLPMSSEQLKVLLCSTKSTWHSPSLVSNDNLSRSFLGLIPSLCFVWQWCLCRDMWCSRSKVVMFLDLLGINRKKS